MREKTIKIWQEKTDLLAQNGVMVLVNVHLDYIDINGDVNAIEEFSINLYKNFLIYLKEFFKDNFWNPLPSVLAKRYLKSIKGII